ncbi:MAG: citrate lyase subunit alpha [Candidatus Coatesbacteria bacterium]|nr:citrate lyase subunit alpha [Candidatus Coatesbacteria bacterium]
MKNILGREIPESLHNFKPYRGRKVRPNLDQQVSPPLKTGWPAKNKVVKSLREVIKLTGLKDGMTVATHHHLQDRDQILIQILEAIKQEGIRNITLAPTGLFPCHRIIIPYIQDGTIGHIEGDISGEVGRFICEGNLSKPVIIRSHTARLFARFTGKQPVDVAFLAVSASDRCGNSNGISGANPFGSMGYAITEARYAKQVVVVTNTILPYPLQQISLSQEFVDWVVEVEQIGKPIRKMPVRIGMVSNPIGYLIARYAIRFGQAAGFIKKGFSFQIGSGALGAEIGRALLNTMKEQELNASFISGGITGAHVEMLKEGWTNMLLDVESMDAEAVESLLINNNHQEISATTYANPFTQGCVVNELDIVFLGATEIDTDFNVNVSTESNGLIKNTVGGHSDVAGSAKFSVILAPAFRNRISTIKNEVIAVNTPGDCVDALVTEYGICINPKKEDILEKVVENDPKLPIIPIEELMNKIQKLTGTPKPLEFDEKIVAVWEYADGTVLDVLRKVKI